MFSLCRQSGLPCRVSLVADRSRFRSGLSQPIFEPGLSELRPVIGDECSLLHLDAVIAAVRVSDNLARVLVCGQAFQDHFIEMGPFRSLREKNRQHPSIPCVSVRQRNLSAGCPAEERRSPGRRWYLPMFR